MEIVEGHTNISRIEIALQKGKLTVYSISEAKLKQFRDGGTLAGRMNDWTYSLFTCCISFFTALLTTGNIIVKYVFATLTIICLGMSIALFFITKNKKRELSTLYEEVISGNV